MTKEDVEQAFTAINNYIKQLEDKLAAKEEEIQNMKDKAAKLASDKENAAEKLQRLEDEMSQLSTVYEELKGQQDMRIDFQEVVKLYVILTEQVLDGSAHIKLLTLLHGKKDTMTKSELSKASGILPAATLRAIFDLRNNGLVNYNEQNEEVKLVRRLFE